MEKSVKKMLVRQVAQEIVAKLQSNTLLWGEFYEKTLPSATRKLSYWLDMDVNPEDLEAVASYLEKSAISKPEWTEFYEDQFDAAVLHIVEG